VSALKGDGLDALWDKLQEFRALSEREGAFEHKRSEQLRRWMWSMVEDGVLTALRAHPEVRRRAPALEAGVLAGKITPTLAARELLEAFGLLRDEQEG
jgi:LAO/AO transport system kinase